MIRRSHHSTLFPYTTLFRSMADQENILDHLTNVFQEYEATLNGLSGNAVHEFRKRSFDSLKQVQFPDRKHEDWKYTRSEEHTSELQSPCNLVCRLLLAKKTK